MRKKYHGSERRKFLRLDYATPLAYKVCKKTTISKLLKGYTSNVSPAGLLCNIKGKVKKGDILWLSFKRDVLSICEELDRISLIYQSGVVGKVVRIGRRKNHTYDVGVRFITRKERNKTHIYPKIHFLKDKFRLEEPQETEEELEPQDYQKDESWRYEEP